MTIATEGCWDTAYRPTSGDPGVRNRDAAAPASAAASIMGEPAPAQVSAELASASEQLTLMSADAMAISAERPGE